ncbi:hypothetical protein EPK99_06555 [Neorhizobium lilium]|uniref:Uncharacterized protein n=2 Tax=Neorhizobium lilium TaxID=2503024 RepID=A0A3S3RLN4_9HYPH|nr:hypothetical protein EPK99_06555 [Neorhizobium lilium]
MGLDIATRSGWAVRQSWKHRSQIKCGTFYVGTNDEGDKLVWEAKYAVAGNMFYRLLKEYQPDFVAIETPEHNIRKYTKQDEDKPRIDTGAIRSFIQRLSAVMMKYGMFSSQAAQVVEDIAGSSSNSNQMQLSGMAGAITATCMLMNIPYGTIGSRRWHTLCYGKGNVPPAGSDWKDFAIQDCEREGIDLPRTKAEQRDAAEAVGICRVWESCDIPNIKWMQDRVKDLRSQADIKLQKQAQAGQVAA